MSTGIDWRVVRQLHLKAFQWVKRSDMARKRGDMVIAVNHMQQAMHASRRAADMVRDTDREPERSNLFATAAAMAFNCGEYVQAQAFVEDGLKGKPSGDCLIKLKELHRAAHWAQIHQNEAASCG